MEYIDECIVHVGIMVVDVHDLVLEVGGEEIGFQLWGVQGYIKVVSSASIPSSAGIGSFVGLSPSLFMPASCRDCVCAGRSGG